MKAYLIAASILTLAACTPEAELANDGNEMANEMVMPTEETGAMNEESDMAGNMAAAGNRTSSRSAGDPDTPVASDGPADDANDECGASRVQSYVGREATASVRAEVASRSGARGIRWIEPDMAVTMDFRPDRLNATLDEDDRITRIYCS